MNSAHSYTEGSDCHLENVVPVVTGGARRVGMLRIGVIDGIETTQNITKLDIWSDVSKWTPEPENPHHAVAIYLIRISPLNMDDPYLFEADAGPVYYFTARWNSVTAQFMPCFDLNVGVSQMTDRIIEWKVIN